jgi:hypothetical protein
MAKIPTKQDSDRSKGYHTYVTQDWMRQKLQAFELMRRLRDDPYFRAVWVDNAVKQRCKADRSLFPDVERDLLLAYLNELDFKIDCRPDGRPVVHISPKIFRGRGYGAILGISSANQSSCLARLIEQAVLHVQKSYGIGSVLSGMFGPDFGRRLNNYIKRRMQEEFG